MSKFWDKVENCKHENLSPDYLKSCGCTIPYCNGYEVHCLDCGVYITKCGCGGQSGMSGWSQRRWWNYNLRNTTEQIRYHRQFTVNKRKPLDK